MLYSYAILVNSSITIMLTPSLLVASFLLVTSFYFICDKKIIHNMDVKQFFNSLELNLNIYNLFAYASLNLLHGGILSFTYKHSMVHHGLLSSLIFYIALIVSIYICICICFNIVLYFYPGLNTISSISFMLNRLLPLVVIYATMSTAFIFIISIHSGPILLDSPVGDTLLSYVKNYFSHLESINANGVIQPTSITLPQLLRLLDQGYTINGHVISANPLISKEHIIGQLRMLPLRYVGTDPIVRRFCFNIVGSDHHSITIYSTTNARNSVGSKILDALIDAGI